MYTFFKYMYLGYIIIVYVKILAKDNVYQIGTTLLINYAQRLLLRPKPPALGMVEGQVRQNILRRKKKIEPHYCYAL